ncbi:MAG TPA: ABC transporter ATP-binding protein [Chloroflexota bacterium]
MASGGPAVHFEHIWKSFQSRNQPAVEALRDVDLEVGENEFLAIVGLSGCGKSTLLNLCAGLLFPDRGRVVFRGEPVLRVNPRAGYLTQDANLLPWLTLRENVALPLEIKGLPAPDRGRQAGEWIELMGLDGFEGHYPHQLSGGMQKRAAIARTLAYDPDVLLMDEPFGPLDAITRLTLQDELLELWGRRKKTIVFVTHDLTEAISLADRVVIMTGRPGQIKAILPVPLARPRDVFHIAETSGFAELHRELWDVFSTELQGVRAA